MAQTTKQKLYDVLIDVNFSEIAHRYFGKSASWLYHKLDEVDVNRNGHPAKFTDEELAQLKEALLDLSKRIAIAAEEL